MKADIRNNEEFYWKRLVKSSDVRRVRSQIKADGAIECSAKDGTNIDEVMKLAIKAVATARSPKAPSCTLL